MKNSNEGFTNTPGNGQVTPFRTDFAPEAGAETPCLTDVPGNGNVTPFNSHSTDYQKVKLPMPREFNGTTTKYWLWLRQKRNRLMH